MKYNEILKMAKSMSKVTDWCEGWVNFRPASGTIEDIFTYIYKRFSNITFKVTPPVFLYFGGKNVIISLDEFVLGEGRFFVPNERWVVEWERPVWRKVIKMFSSRPDVKGFPFQHPFDALSTFLTYIHATITVFWETKDEKLLATIYRWTRMSLEDFFTEDMFPPLTEWGVDVRDQH